MKFLLEMNIGKVRSLQHLLDQRLNLLRQNAGCEFCKSEIEKKLNKTFLAQLLKFISLLSFTLKITFRRSLTLNPSFSITDKFKMRSFRSKKCYAIIVLEHKQNVSRWIKMHWNVIVRAKYPVVRNNRKSDWSIKNL